MRVVAVSASLVIIRIIMRRVSNRKVEGDKKVKKNLVVFPAIVISLFRFGVILGVLTIIFFLYAYFKMNGGISHIILGIVIFLILSLLYFMFNRWRVEIEGDSVTVIPMLGKKKKVSLSEIKQIIKKESGAVVLIRTNGKKFVSIEPQSDGLQNFLNALKKEGISF
ncbi:DUF6560 family protein [Enterococcus sp. LJL51]|uniref:DUF6560 family protein n=1 Tax=Enterococcus sp. LJL51 TaxID=3416656 RepID=UPI003CEC5910